MNSQEALKMVEQLDKNSKVFKATLGKRYYDPDGDTPAAEITGVVRGRKSVVRTEVGSRQITPEARVVRRKDGSMLAIPGSRDSSISAHDANRIFNVDFASEVGKALRRDSNRQKAKLNSPKSS